MLEILAATSNVGKVRELTDLFTGIPIRLRNLREFDGLIEPEETGLDFSENAGIKASYYSRQTGLWSVADDSGLEVLALNGAPGIFSARYGGIDSSDAGRIHKLLEELKETGDPERRARFVCSLAVSDHSGEIRFLIDGVCNGRIALTPQGSAGFGYDPIFVPEGYDQSFGQLPIETKRRISHRAVAFRKLIELLRDICSK